MKNTLVIDIEAEKQEILKRYRALLRASKSTLQKGDKKLINSWAFYDWANSVYSLVIATAVFPLYYSAVTKDQVVRFLWVEWEHPDTLYSYALSFSFLRFYSSYVYADRIP